MLVRIRSGRRIYDHPDYEEYFNITVQVQKVYKMRGQRNPRGTINVLACDLPDEILKDGQPRRNARLLIMGNVKDDSNLVVDSNGYIEIRGKESKRKGRACKP